jgi:hypothetical protein
MDGCAIWAETGSLAAGSSGLTCTSGGGCASSSKRQPKPKTACGTETFRCMGLSNLSNCARCALQDDGRDGSPQGCGPWRRCTSSCSGGPETTNHNMSSASIAATHPTRAPAGRAIRHDFMLIVALALLVATAWALARTGWFDAGDDLGYWLGVAGGVLMLVLLLYPARKHLRVMRNLGKVKAWFWMHLFCGIFGPWLILVHSTFRIGSMNAGVALWSMVIVVLSGVVGRFLFVRVQQDLGGERATLQQRREELGLAGSSARSMLQFAPDVLDRLRAFEQRELPRDVAGKVPLLRLLLLPLRHTLEKRRCAGQLRSRLIEQARAASWSPGVLRQHQRRAQRELQRYFGAMLRVAHFSLFDRLFALWHVAHLPFVVLLAISAVVHVVAVHAY